MKELLIQQYALITGSRAVVLDFLEQQLPNEAFQVVNQFSDNSPGKMMLHIANVYFHWIGNFSLGLNIDIYPDQYVSSIGLLRSIFEEVDQLMEIYLNQFGDTPNEKISGTISNRSLKFDVLKLFTHVITHEFHHKGQVMSMCRLLGHTPVDADVIH